MMNSSIISYSDEIVSLIEAARSELDQHRCYQLLEEANRLCDHHIEDGGGELAVLLRVQIMTELATEEQEPKRRSSIWCKALSSLSDQWNDAPSPLIAESYGATAVNFAQDQYCSTVLIDIPKYLRTAKKRIESEISKSNDDKIIGFLLCRKSTILRHLSRYEVGDDNRLRIIEESCRCAELSVNKYPDPAYLLEFAISLWAKARHDKQMTDEEYVEVLCRVEDILLDERLSNSEPAQLTIARFYRLSFRPLDACEEYKLLINRAKGKRRIVRESFIYAEAAIQLWYANYPEDITNKHLREAMSLLETATAAGYNYARIIIDTAFIRGIIDGDEAGQTALSDICSNEGDVDWQQALLLVTNKVVESEETNEPRDYPIHGFALGIDQSAVWTRLGTFAKRFLQNMDLAKVMYQAAVRMNRRDPIALTNLARFLINEGSDESYIAARRLLQTAQQFSDRRFTWWRIVLAELDEKQKCISAPHTKTVAKVMALPSIEHIDSLKVIRKRFRSIESIEDTQKRGYELEVLVYELAKLTFSIAKPAYRYQRITSGESQVDSYFEHKGEKYRVECKWVHKPVEKNEIILFVEKLDIAGISGLFISMSGFTDAAIGCAREKGKDKAILLVDGEEAKALFNREIIFDDLVTRKRLSYDQRSEVYHKVNASSDDSFGVGEL